MKRIPFHCKSIQLALTCNAVFPLIKLYGKSYHSLLFFLKIKYIKKGLRNPFLFIFKTLYGFMFLPFENF